MPDLLVNLLRLPPVDPLVAEVENSDILIRRAQPFEITMLRDFIKHNFSLSWADECSVAFANKPISLYIAIHEGQLVGFAAYECTRKAFFGPTGVLEEFRGLGVGKALLLLCLKGLREMGYVYGIIGGVGPVEFYRKTVGAVVITDSDPGIYTQPLR